MASFSSRIGISIVKRDFVKLFLREAKNKWTFNFAMSVIFVSGKRSVLFPVKRDRSPLHPPLPPSEACGSAHLLRHWLSLYKRKYISATKTEVINTFLTFYLFSWIKSFRSASYFGSERADSNTVQSYSKLCGQGTWLVLFLNLSFNQYSRMFFLHDEGEE